MPIQSNPPSETGCHRQQVLEVVKQIIGEHMGIVPDTIEETNVLEADLGCDSLDVVEIGMETEEHFEISGADEDEFMDQNLTVADVVDGVMQRLVPAGRD